MPNYTEMTLALEYLRRITIAIETIANRVNVTANGIQFVVAVPQEVEERPGRHEDPFGEAAKDETTIPAVNVPPASPPYMAPVAPAPPVFTPQMADRYRNAKPVWPAKKKKSR